MHAYTFAFTYPKEHEINKDGEFHKYLVMINAGKKLGSIQCGEKCDVEIHHGSTPASPTVMTLSNGTAVGEESRVVVKSNFITIKFLRNELHFNPMPWRPNFEGEIYDTPIYYEFIEDEN